MKEDELKQAPNRAEALRKRRVRLKEKNAETDGLLSFGGALISGSTDMEGCEETIAKCGQSKYLCGGMDPQLDTSAHLIG
jgi:hypothetical protein